MVKLKEKKFHLSFKVFFRLLIFFLIIYFGINWFSQQKPKVLGSIDTTLSIDEEQQKNFLSDLYQKIPESSRYQLEHFNENKTVIFIQDQLNGFPQKQIKEIQKNIIKDVSKNMIENIDKN